MNTFPENMDDRPRPDAIDKLLEMMMDRSRNETAWLTMEETLREASFDFSSAMKLRTKEIVEEHMREYGYSEPRLLELWAYARHRAEVNLFFMRDNHEAVLDDETSEYIEDWMNWCFVQLVILQIRAISLGDYAAWPTVLRNLSQSQYEDAFDLAPNYRNWVWLDHE